MNRKLTTLFSVIIIVAFIGYMIYDSVKTPEKQAANSTEAPEAGPEEVWKIGRVINFTDGALKAVATGKDGLIYAGGDSFIACLDGTFNKLWSVSLPYPVTCLAAHGDTILAAAKDLIMVLDRNGKVLEEWGPYEAESIITSVAFNGTYTALADAGNKIVFILDKKGAVVSMMGQNNDQFIVPSPYFDVALDAGNHLFIANTGHRRIETRNLDGEVLGYFGEPGTAPGAFCGCCNPAHFALFPGGFVTAEKGINRIKIMEETGQFREFISSEDRFLASIPLDVASFDGTAVYAANPADSKLYEFIRK